VNPVTGNHFGGSLAMIPFVGKTGYIGLTAFVINVIVAAAVTLILRMMGRPNGHDETTKGDYFADEGDPRVEKHIVKEPHLVGVPA
jgi:solute:Na+ symporter, SSS family